MTGLPADAGELAVTTNRGVATLWLNRPAKHNAVTYDMWVGITEHTRRLGQDPTVRMLVVRGAGDHFCAGADIAGLSAAGFGGADGGSYQRANEAADEALASFPKPTLALITGSCIGGGAEIAVACDLRIADRTARFGITPARLGLIYPELAIERVVRLIGPAASKYLLYTAELIDADRALRVGLVNEVHPPEELQARADAMTGLIARQRSLLTQVASKEMVDRVVADGAIDADTSRRWRRALAESDDPGEGIAAFLERRQPQFTWAPPTDTDSPGSSA
jgi:enoyl-CoA hydratase/carnithine racemase